MFFQKKKWALATVCTPNFLPGCLVMLDSFRRHNPWFDGDILIWHDQLPATQQAVLATLGQVQFRQVSAPLLERIQALLPDYADFERRKAQFYSLDMLRCTEYRQLLFLDSDILITDSLAPLMEREEALLCCGTVRYYRPASHEDGDPFAVERFNAGMMRIQHSLTGERTWQALLDMVSPAFFAPFLAWAERHQLPRVGTDQIILNTYFAGQATFVSGRYNFRMGIAREIAERDQCGLAQAAVIHYTGGKKPWMPEKVLTQLQRGGHDPQIYFKWMDAWRAATEALSRS